MKFSFLNPSGGIVYHKLAWNYRKVLWRPFHHWIQNELKSWDPPKDQLFLLGPSAGYSLDPEFLARFKKLIISEPDPLARFLLKRRFPDSQIEWDNKDYLFRDKVFRPEGLLELRESYPQTGILFCNILGQLPFLVPNSQHYHLRLKEVLQKVFEGPAASYHDLYSTHLPRKCKFKARDQSWKTPEDLMIEIKKSCSDSISFWDHGLQKTFPVQIKGSYGAWMLHPKALHIVECLHHV